jgi:hypothetical protein
LTIHTHECDFRIHECLFHTHEKHFIHNLSYNTEILRLDFICKIHLDDSQLTKTKIIIKKYVKYLEKDYTTDFPDFYLILFSHPYNVIKSLLDYYSVATSFLQFFRRAKKQVFSETILMIA